MRTTRTVRRLLATAVTAGALFALPAAASAAPDLNIDVQGPATGVAGETVNYTVILTNDGDADSGSAASIALSTLGTFPGTVGVPSVNPALSDASDTDNELLVYGFGAGSIVIPAGFDWALDGDAVAFTVPVTLPTTYTPTFRVSGTLTAAGGDGGGDFDNSDPTTVSKGGPSNVQFRTGLIGPAGADGVLGKWVKKDTAAVTTVTATNTGTGPAYFVEVEVGADGNASPLSPEGPAPFTAFRPIETIGAGACVPMTVGTVDAPATCQIAELAAGASVTIPVAITNITHYGDISVRSNVLRKADNGNDSFLLTPCATPDGCDEFNYAQITDGTTAEPHNDLGTDTVAAGANADVSFKGELTNNGPGEIKNAVLTVSAPSFLADGTSAPGAVYEGDAGVSQSIQNVTVPGATCANYVNPDTSKKQLDRFVCVIPSLPSGARLLYSVGAKFATVKETTGYVSTRLDTASFNSDASEINAYDDVRLNVSKFSDLSITAKSPALVGVGHVTPIDLVITNTGNTPAKTTYLGGNIQFGVGTFDGESQSPFCLSTVDPESVRCTQNELAAGASRTVTVYVKAGTKLGALPVSFNIGYNGIGTDINPDNNSLVQTMTIVKANAAPLLGVTANKFKAAKLAAIVKTGLKTEVKTPGAATVKVDMAVTPKVAVQLGLIKKAGKKNVVIGTKTMKTTKAGKVMVVTKFSLKYKAKVAKAKAKFAVMRIVTVTSNEKKNAGATSLTTSTTAFTVVKAKKKK